MMIAPKTANKTDAQKIAEKIACANMILRPQFGQVARDLMTAIRARLELWFLRRRLLRRGCAD